MADSKPWIRSDAISVKLSPEVVASRANVARQIAQSALRDQMTPAKRPSSNLGKRYGSRHAVFDFRRRPKPWWSARDNALVIAERPIKHK
jgi:hypothetical protein